MFFLCRLQLLYIYFLFFFIFVVRLHPRIRFPRRHPVEDNIFLWCFSLIHCHFPGIITWDNWTPCNNKNNRNEIKHDVYINQTVRKIIFSFFFIVDNNTCILNRKLLLIRDSHCVDIGLNYIWFHNICGIDTEFQWRQQPLTFMFHNVINNN